MPYISQLEPIKSGLEGEINEAVQSSEIIQATNPPTNNVPAPTINEVGGTSIIADVPMTQPIIPATTTPSTGTSIIAEPTVPVVEPVKPPTASVTITNVPLVGDGITGILGSIGGIGGGSGIIEEPSPKTEINASMPNLLLYLGIALAIVVGYKVIKK